MQSCLPCQYGVFLYYCESHGEPALSIMPIIVPANALYIKYELFANIGRTDGVDCQHR